MSRKAEEPLNGETDPERPAPTWHVGPIVFSLFAITLAALAGTVWLVVHYAFPTGEWVASLLGFAPDGQVSGLMAVGMSFLSLWLVAVVAIDASGRIAAARRKKKGERP